MAVTILTLFGGSNGFEDAYAGGEACDGWNVERKSHGMESNLNFTLYAQGLLFYAG